MLALVISEKKPERDVVAGHLQQAGYRVNAAADRAAASAFLEGELPDVVIVSWSPAAVDIVRKVRCQEDAKHTYILALLDKEQPALVIPAILQAGGDDFLRRPILKEELLLRADSPQRIAKWRVAPKSAALDLSTVVDLRNIHAFKNMGALVGADLSQLIGELEIVEGWLMAGELRGACVPMSVPSEQAELRVSIVVEAKLVRTLAGMLLGDESAPATALDDMMREIANTAGGAVKRAALADKLMVTTGLPVNEARGATRNEMTRCWTARIPGTETQLGIIGEVHKRTNQRLPMAKLEENMVLSCDVRNESGALVMTAGTRLTSTTIDRLVGMLGSRFVVDVTAA
jgi:CheY-like chemotaxis protein